MLARVKLLEPELPLCAALAAVLTLAGFLAQAHLGLAPQEEGYLWYGVEAVARGEWPMRDFRSYDPGRYLWCAAWEHVFGHGILGLRAACATFAWLGLTAGLLVARRVVPSRSWLVPAGLVIALWQFPGWRPFESGLSSMATYLALRLVERPSARRSFVCGLFVGVAAFFGRNHGLYAAVAFALVHVVALVGGRAARGAESDGPAARGAGLDGSAARGAGLDDATPSSTRPSPRELLARLASLVGGTVLGYAPMLALIAFVPGFARAFVDSVLFFVGRSDLNIPYPATWPWTIDAARLAGVELAAAIALSAVFVLYVAGYALAGVVALRGRLGSVLRTPAIVAAFCVGLPYVHHVSERSDIHHVAESVHPLLLAVLALAAAAATKRPKLASGVALAALLAISVLAIGTEHPLGKRLLARGTPREFVAFDARGTELSIDGVVAQRLAAVRARVEREVPRDDAVLFSTKPLVLYPLLGRRAPVWDVYPSWKADAQYEQRMLDELSTVDWAFLQDLPVGGVEEKRFANTYPAVWRRLQQDYDRIATPELPENFLFLHRR
ncbi:MAG: hypothetical protein IPJ77_10265 [Planctomycetes bacterium]|nr:hypothetical protein [Planctomycetota bacterium]